MSAQKLAEAHWQDYIEPLLRTHRVSDYDLEVIGFHYKSAFIHGYKHGTADAELQPAPWVDSDNNPCSEAELQAYIDMDMENIKRKNQRRHEDNMVSLRAMEKSERQPEP